MYSIQDALTHWANKDMITNTWQIFQSQQTSYFIGLLCVCGARRSKTSRSTQSFCKLVSVSLIVAVWTFLSVAPLAFALINTDALTRSWGPKERGGASHCFTNITQGLVSPLKEGAARTWTDWAVHGRTVRCAAVQSQYSHTCTSRQTPSSFSPATVRKVVFFLVIQPIHPSSLTISHLFVSHQHIALYGA